ncbi:MAG: ATP synthase F1 subunit delta [Candidatus Magasanikbacteria bacterium]
MKKSSNKQYAQALYEITKNLKGADLKQALEVFVKLLVRDRKLKQSSNIIVEFEKYSKKQEGIIEMEITSARKLENLSIEHIKKAFGGKVEAVMHIDESLIGGVKVKLEDKILDGSLKTQLLSFRKSLVL